MSCLGEMPGNTTDCSFHLQDSTFKSRSSQPHLIVKFNSKASDSDRDSTIQKILCKFRVIIDLWFFPVIGEELQGKQTKTAFFCQ